MLLVVGSSAKIQVVTGQAVATDVHASLVDVSSANVVSESTKNTAISTAATTDVTGSPSSGARNVKLLNIANKGASNQTITVQQNDGSVTVQLYTATLSAGQSLVYMNGIGWYLQPNQAQGLPLGLTGATAATRYVGATASGAPASGTFSTGDYIIDQSGSVWVCSSGGSQGTWIQTAPIASPTFTGTATIPTAAVTTLSGTPNFTGNATAVTQASSDNSTRLATTAYVTAAVKSFMGYPVPLKAGAYAFLNTPGGNSSSSFYLLSTGDWSVQPINFTTAVTLTSLAVNVNSTGSNSTIRVGLYNDSNGQPGSLLLDAGAADTHTSSGIKTLTVSQAVSTDTTYWLITVVQGSSIVVPTMFVAGTLPTIIPPSTSSWSAAAVGQCYKIGGTGATGSIAGALPGTLAIGTVPTQGTLMLQVLAGA